MNDRVHMCGRKHNGAFEGASAGCAWVCASRWSTTSIAADPRPLPPAPVQARLALLQPWWTFLDGFEAVRDAAGLRGGVAEVRHALAEAEAMSDMRGGMKTVIKSGAVVV